MNDWATLRATRQRALRVALLPCAGRGERSGAGGPKQYVALHGRSVVHWALLPFDTLRHQGELDGVVVVLSADDGAFESAVPPELRGRVHASRVGGPTRAASVLAGLQELQAQGLHEEDWVLVHDAARCLVMADELLHLIQRCEADPVGGLLAHPVPDTLKRSDAQGRVQSTVPRDHLWAAQTPQMFRLGMLRQALEQAMAAGATVTDEASAIEWAGLQPRLVPGSADNFKVTYPDDFERAAHVLQRRAQVGGTRS
jgi:2-C-methyl-D-erythritol 4-phosphate cytidylyltransferase